MPTDPKDHALARAEAAARTNDRKKAGSPDMYKKINRAERLLRQTIRRTGLPPTLARQAARMVGHFGRKRLKGFHAVWPGMKKMAEWADCGERMARKNFRQLEAGRVISVIGEKKGGCGLATVWSVDPEALKKWLILIGANPSPTLFALLETILIGSPHNPELELEKPGTGDLENPELAGSETDLETRNANPEPNPELSSARRIEIGNRRAGRSNAALAKRRRGGK